MTCMHVYIRWLWGACHIGQYGIHIYVVVQIAQHIITHAYVNAPIAIAAYI